MCYSFEMFYTDKDVARLLKVSASTVREIVRRGPKRQDCVDLRLAEPIVIGGVRRWPVSKLYRLLGLEG